MSYVCNIPVQEKQNNGRWMTILWFENMEKAQKEVKELNRKHPRQYRIDPNYTKQEK